MDSGGIQIKATSDGSCTLYDPSLNETYHSLHGAHSESVYVYIKNGLLLANPRSNTLNILEIGFGTGMNLLLTLNNRPTGLKVNYLSLEPFPVDKDLLVSYYEGFESPFPSAGRIGEIAALENNVWHDLEQDFRFQCSSSRLQDLPRVEALSDWKADLVYYDAFAPSRQPEMWTEEVLKITVDKMAPGSLLTTYCAQGQFKRHLKHLGLELENPEGANGKREMTIARKHG